MDVDLAIYRYRYRYGYRYRYLKQVPSNPMIDQLSLAQRTPFCYVNNFQIRGPYQGPMVLILEA